MYIHEPEPFAVPATAAPRSQRNESWRATFQPQALHECPHLLTSF